MIKQSIAAWVLLAVLMVVNGTVRELVIAPEMDAYTAQVISTAIGIAIVFAFAYFFIRSERVATLTAAWKIGALWTVLTVLFELGLAYATGVRSNALFAAYNVVEGEVWPVLVLAVAVAPAFWVYHFRRIASRPDPRVHFPLIRLG